MELLIMSICYAKKYKIRYKTKEVGNTIVRNKVRQQIPYRKSTNIRTYPIQIKRSYLFKDTEKFTASKSTEVYLHMSNKTVLGIQSPFDREVEDTNE